MASFKSRWVLSSPADCERDDLAFFGSTIRVVKRLSLSPLILLVENVTKDEKSIEEAYFSSWEKINLFCSAISLIGYGRSNLLSHVATLSSEYQSMEQFDVLIDNVLLQEKNDCVIVQSDLEAMQKALEGNYADASLCISYSLRARTLEERAVLLHSGCQEMAKVSGVPTIKQKCKTCGTEIDTGRYATNNYIKKLFSDNVREGDAIYKKFDKLRHKVGHGKPLSSLEEILEANSTIALAQGPIMHRLDTLLAFNRNIGKQAVTRLPVAIYSFKVAGSGFEISMKEFNGDWMLSQVHPGPELKYSGYSFEYGIKEPQIFDSKLLDLIFSPPIDDTKASEEALSAESTASQESSRRNAPCLCGSGKRFKHCCGIPA